MTTITLSGGPLKGRDLAEPRQDWTRAEAEQVFALAFSDLLFLAQQVHRRWHDPAKVQKSRLLSIKTGGCPEDCGYCGQSAHWKTGLAAEKLMPVDDVLDEARRAKAGGAERFCMGAAWRSLKDRDLDAVCDMVAGVKAMGLETCVTLGMLEDGQAERLAGAGLDFYNHNLDTSPDYYGVVTQTRTYDDRLETLNKVRQAGVQVCCGGIVGMGEKESDRIGLLLALATMPEHPGSIPINHLVPVEGTPLGESDPLDGLDLVRVIAAARVMAPKSVVRLSAGREAMSRELQALAFLAGANSIFIGDKLLTTPNPALSDDARLFADLGLAAAPA